MSNRDNMKSIYKAKLSRNDAPQLFCIADNLGEAAKILEEYLIELKEENPMCFDLDIEGYIIETKIDEIIRVTSYVRY